MFQIQGTSTCLVLLVTLTAIQCGSTRQKKGVVLANQASKTSTLLTKNVQISQANQSYAEAQCRIQVALNTQTVELNLQGLSLTQLPAEIGQLTNLQWLSLNNNQLSSLPAEIGQLTNLQWLSLDNNQLSSLPAEIGQLTNLQWLSLDNNQLSSLPAEIGQLTNLQWLFLDRNQLDHLPAEIEKLRQSTYISLKGNPVASDTASLNDLDFEAWLNGDANLPNVCHQ